MKCSFCGCLTGARPPNDWRVCAELVLCPDCAHHPFRRRRLTMRVAEPVGAPWCEFNAVFSEALGQAALLMIPSREWQLTIAEGRPQARVSIHNRWWALRLRSAKWSRGRRAVYQKIASGEAIAAQLLLFRRRTINHAAQERAELFCSTSVWLPGALVKSGVSPPAWRFWRFRREQNIEELSIASLRAAVRANAISFPSQVQAFSGCGTPDLQRKVVQLYFLLGWSTPDIAARYGLIPQQVQLVLNAWKLRAVRAGYLEHITEPIGGLAAAGSAEEELRSDEPRLSCDMKRLNQKSSSFFLSST